MLELAALFLGLAVIAVVLHVLFAAVVLAFKVALFPLKLVLGLAGSVIGFVILLPLVLVAFPVALALGVVTLVVGGLFLGVIAICTAAAA